MPESLWGEEFNIPDEKEKTKKIIEKVKKPKEVKAKPEKVLKSKTITLEERLKVIEDNVRKILGKQVGNAIVINTVEEYQAYIDSCIKSGYVAVDTETNNSLDPITCKIMGLCLYTPGRKQAYVPVNHEDYISQTRLEKQLTEEQIADGLRRLIDAGTFVIMHNGKFDYQVIKCTCGVEMPIDWDTMIAYKLIDENEFSVGLKQLYIKLIDPEQEKYSIDYLFEGVPYAFVDTFIFALYSATDALMTYKLYEYEKDIMTSDDYSRIYQLFKNIEMPCVIVTAEMELAGVEVDQEYAQRLQVKYHKQLDNLDTDIQKFLDSIKETVNKWRLTPEARAPQWRKQTQNQYDISLNGENFNKSYWKNENGQWYKLSKSKSEQLDEELTPETLASPIQLGIILYDILNCPVVNKDAPYATGSDELKKLVNYTPLCKLMIKRRELVKLLTGYIDTIPELAKRWPDGRVRTHFNQYGAATGRFSSSDPINLQNIPSHNKELRMMFRAREGCVLIGSDFSQQEPRLLSKFAQDKNMIAAYNEGKDLYATIATGVYHNKYEDNLELYPDGTLNSDGKARRSSCKGLLLGIMYSRGAASIADQIGGTVEDAQKIINNFYKSFPNVEKFVAASEKMARDKGYVEDLWGRRRRLPDILLPRFTITHKSSKGVSGDFNPFIGCKNREVVDKIIQSYKEQLENAKSKKQIDLIKKKAEIDGINIVNNGGFISQAQRQCVNARIQGSAATMTKLAMVKIHNDKELKDLGFRLLIGVHDELIGECPVENQEQAAKLLTRDMATCVGDNFGVPFKCDADLSFNWYWSDYCAKVRQEFLDIKDKEQEEAFKIICENHTELTEENLREVIFRDFKNESDSDWQKRFERMQDKEEFNYLTD